MAEFEKINIFGKTTLADVFKQIHGNQKKIDVQISDMLGVMTPFIKSAGEAVILMPVIKDLIDVNVKNNDQLVKMAGIVQRTMSKDDEGGFVAFENELAQLVEDNKKIESTTKEITDKSTQYLSTATTGSASNSFVVTTNNG